MDITKTKTQSRILDSGTAKIDMAIEFLEDAMSALKHTDADEYPCIKDNMAVLQRTIYKLDAMSARLEKEASKGRVR
mgnify:FL=1